MRGVVLYLILLSLLQSGAEAQFSWDNWSVKQLVEYHQHLRPQMQVQDVYKMLYQANFGVEHILTDTTGVRTYLMQELASKDTTVPSEPMLERISTSGEVVRVNLRPFREMNLNPQGLIQLMYRSAMETRPDTLMFYREWNEFCSLVRYDLLKFPLNEVEEWDERVLAGVLQQAHHSQTYIQEYKPAYRVVRRGLFESTFTLKDGR